MNRRDFFSHLVPGRWFKTDGPGVTIDGSEAVAVIAGRHCLAYQGSFCSTCRERCPVTGAIVIERGLPRVDPGLCNGCRICHDVCPAPTNAVRLVRKPHAVATMTPGSKSRLKGATA